VKKVFFVACFGALVILPGFLFFACEQPVPEAWGDTEVIRINGIPEGVNGKKPYKIYTQISAGTGIEAGYVAKGEALTGGRNTAVTGLFDPDGKPWAGEGSYNIAVVISPQTVTTVNDIAVHAAMPRLSSQVQSFTWGDMLNLEEMGMKKQIQDVFEGIVCALEETDVSHPVRWVAGTGSAEVIFLLNKTGDGFSLHLSGVAESFGLDAGDFFLVTGGLEGSGPSYTLKNVTTNFGSEGDLTPEEADAHAKAQGMSEKTVTLTESGNQLTLSSTDSTVTRHFARAYTKK
jgi:hypothetical protein